MEGFLGLSLAKLEYQGRRTRAETFYVWKDLLRLQVESLGPLGAKYWQAVIEAVACVLHTFQRIL
eukprot:131201-Amphidinium_carterae.1